MRQALANAERLAWIARVLLRHGFAHLLGARLPGPQRLAAVLEGLGGTFIKLGQMLALQPDILSLAYCNALFDLLDRVAPFRWEEAARVLREETGRPPEELFDSLEREPFAAASIGQVYRGVLGGRRVAVKVQRPSVEVDFAGDVRLMSAAMSLIRRLRLVRLYWMIEPMNEFVGWTQEELDYRNEARYMRQLRDDARDNPAEHVPEVLIATRRLLVVEFLDGTTVLDYLRAAGEGDEVRLRRLTLGGFDANLFAQRMIDNFLGDAFQHGLFHADLHPANLMILQGNVVGYVDFGITGVLSHYSRYHLVAMTLAYTRGDTAGMAASFLKVSTLDRGADARAFQAGLERFAEEWYERGQGSRLRKNFTLVMLDMLRLSRATGIWPERDVIKYIRSAIAIDGLITRFAPGFSVGQHLAAVCDRHLRQESRRALFGTQRLAAWAEAVASLAADGPTRAVAALDRSRAAAEAMPEAEIAYTASRAPGRPRGGALPPAAAAFALALALSGWSGPTELGWNLFTAGVALVGASLALLTARLSRRAG